jgi:hypothetical protein
MMRSFAHNQLRLQVERKMVGIVAISRGRELQSGWISVGITFLTLLATAGAMSISWVP